MNNKMKNRAITDFSKWINEHDEHAKWLDVKDTEDERPRLSTFGIKFPSKTSHMKNKIRIDNTIKYQVLKFIYDSGHQGRSYSEILRFIMEDIKGEEFNATRHRGYHASTLIGDNRYTGQMGLLYKYCDKNENGKWVLSNSSLVDHFNDKWAREEAGWDKDDIDMYDELGILGKMASNFKDK